MGRLHRRTERDLIRSLFDIVVLPGQGARPQSLRPRLRRHHTEALTVRSQPNTFRDTWISYAVDTHRGRLELTVFPGPPPFFGCTRLDGVPIAAGVGTAGSLRLAVNYAALASAMGLAASFTIVLTAASSAIGSM